MEVITISRLAKRHKVSKQAITKSITEKQRGKSKSGILFEFRGKLYTAKKVGNQYFLYT